MSNYGTSPPPNKFEGATRNLVLSWRGGKKRGKGQDIP